MSSDGSKSDVSLSSTRSRRWLRLMDGTTSSPRPCSISLIPLISPEYAGQSWRSYDDHMLNSCLRTIPRPKLISQVSEFGANDIDLNGIAISVAQPPA